MDLGLGGAAVVINGGSKGLGRAAAEVMAAEGARIALLARGAAALAGTAAALRSLGAPQVLEIPTDLTDRGQVDAAFTAIRERWGEINVLVNAAGPVDVGVGRRFDELDDAEWVATFDIGTLSA